MSKHDLVEIAGSALFFALLLILIISILAQ